MKYVGGCSLFAAASDHQWPQTREELRAKALCLQAPPALTKVDESVGARSGLLRQTHTSNDAGAFLWVLLLSCSSKASSSEMQTLHPTKNILHRRSNFAFHPSSSPTLTSKLYCSWYFSCLYHIWKLTPLTWLFLDHLSFCHLIDNYCKLSENLRCLIQNIFM